jgi:S-formylglutathione hydrolase FrmB
MMLHGIRKILQSITLSALLLLIFAQSLSAADGEATIIDSRHYSNVFGEVRNYRIFLPPGYSENPGKRYPVIYFFHGWSQRYFGSSNPYADYDKGDENKGDNIANFVSKHEVIVVKADGYNRSLDEKYYVRPYNVSPVETFRQFPLYFPELVEHVDSNYRTIANREHRGISGLSMGGFMTFWIGGKYPHLLSAAGNFCGSPEFSVGPKDFPVEYRHLDMYHNYAGMNLRLHYGNKDFIRGYHQDLNRVWPQVIDHYDYKVFNAAHSTCGLGEMFSFILKTFENPPARPLRWDHIDVYPDFSVWDYQVNSNRMVPGFTVLENVDKRGFRCSVRKFLPDGELLSFVKVSVTTPPVYGKNQAYTINDIDVSTGKATRQTLISNGEGRLTIRMNGNTHEIGINRKTDNAHVVLAAVDVQNMPWATHKKGVAMSLTLLNKGLSPAKNIRATVSATRPTARVIQADIPFGNLVVNESKGGSTTFQFRVDVDSVVIERFKVTLRDDNNNQWVEFFEVPLKKDLPEITEVAIADGRTFTVAQSGVDTTTVLLGTGNGDGVANPGESIVVLIKDQEKWWRADLTSSDPYINPVGINIRKSDNWSSFDHVGASAKYDVPLIASDCPQNHQLQFFAEYWMPDYPHHIIRQGVVKIPVRGTDTTPPFFEDIRLAGDNVLQIKIYDGSPVQYVKARLIQEKDPDKFVEIVLRDDGASGDGCEKDRVFSRRIPAQGFGIYRVVFEATDAYGNKSVKESEGSFVVH